MYDVLLHLTCDVKIPSNMLKTRTFYFCEVRWSRKLYGGDKHESGHSCVNYRRLRSSWRLKAKLNLADFKISYTKTQKAYSILIIALTFLFFICLQEVQILKTFVLGEEERGQSQFQVRYVFCHACTIWRLHIFRRNVKITAGKNETRVITTFIALWLNSGLGIR